MEHNDEGIVDENDTPESSKGPGSVLSARPRAHDLMKEREGFDEPSPERAGEDASRDRSSDMGRGGIVTARGTSDGLVLRLDGRVELLPLQRAMREFMASRQSFLSGNQVALEWVGIEPPTETVDELSRILGDEFGIAVRSSRLREGIVTTHTEEPSSGASKGASLFGGLGFLKGDARVSSGSNRTVERSAPRGTDPSRALWDDPDARVLYTTLRSGQRIESEHTVVVCGDVNSGAEIVAGGDIIVLGTLRGVAHAGAYDETGGGRFIFALNLQPTQLRIGSTISRGSSENREAPEIARVDGALIVVEPYQARTMSRGRLS